MTLQPQQFGQLKMFMTAPEIKATYAAGDAIADGVPQDHLWQSKLNETARGWDYDAAPNEAKHFEWRKLNEDIDAEGVKTPVSILHGMQSKAMPSATSAVNDGHHRVAYEAARHPDRLMPVWHNDTSGNYKPVPGSYR
jgi:hypothetical protein